MDQPPNESSQTHESCSWLLSRDSLPPSICSLANTRERRGWMRCYRVNANLTAFVEMYHNTYNTSLWYSTKLSLLLPNGWAVNKWIIQPLAVAWPALTRWAQHLVAQVADVPCACYGFLHTLGDSLSDSNESKPQSAPLKWLLELPAVKKKKKKITFCVSDTQSRIPPLSEKYIKSNFSH